MTKSEFYKHVKKGDIDAELNSIYNQTEYDEFKKLFKILCNKCGGEARLITFDDIKNGSELTGTFGDAGVIIKCYKCGNALKINSASL